MCRAWLLSHIYALLMCSCRTREDDKNPFKIKWNKFHARPTSGTATRAREERMECSMGRDDFLRERINDDMKQQQKECNKVATKVILTTNDFRMSVFIIPALTCGSRRCCLCCCSGCCYFPVFLFLFVVFSLSQEGREKSQTKHSKHQKNVFISFIFCR